MVKVLIKAFVTKCNPKATPEEKEEAACILNHHKFLSNSILAALGTEVAILTIAGGLRIKENRDKRVESEEKAECERVAQAERERQTAEETAANKLQAHIKGAKARQEFKQKKNVAVKLHAVARGFLERKHLRQAQERAEAAAQAAQADRERLDQEKAATEAKEQAEREREAAAKAEREREAAAETARVAAAREATRLAQEAEAETARLAAQAREQAHDRAVLRSYQAQQAIIDEQQRKIENIEEQIQSAEKKVDEANRKLQEDPNGETITETEKKRRRERLENLSRTNSAQAEKLKTDLRVTKDQKMEAEGWGWLARIWRRAIT